MRPTPSRASTRWARWYATGRCGVEIEEKYFAIAVKRIKQALADREASFDFAKPNLVHKQLEIGDA